MRSLRILVSAYACAPNQGSEPGVGWNIARELAKHHIIWVLTREENRKAIETEMSTNPVPNLKFTYCKLPVIIRWLRSAQLPHYYLWQVAAYFVGKQLHNQIHFDVLHHVTYVRYSTPSYLSLLPVPFIWGPVGGGETAPSSFWKDFSVSAKGYEILRSLSHHLGELDPFTRLTIKRSRLIRATTEDTAKRLRQMGASTVDITSESGLAWPEINCLTQCSYPAESPIRVISIARLLHWKGLHLGIRAFARANLQSDSEYWIVGEGPELKNLQALTAELEVHDRVKFLGRLPREETLAHLSLSHILLHPSLHDSGGWVCLEAMAAGRPVVCLNIGGPAIQVTEEVGIKVPAHTPQQVVEDLAKGMTHIASHPKLRIQMGQAGRDRIKQLYSWESKCLEIAALYRKVAQSSRLNDLL